MYTGGAFLNLINILINISVASWADLCCDYIERRFPAGAVQTAHRRWATEAHHDPDPGFK